jgi:hypothetical protein
MMYDRAFWLPYLDSEKSNLYRSPLIFPGGIFYFFAGEFYSSISLDMTKSKSRP